MWTGLFIFFAGVSLYMAKKKRVAGLFAAGVILTALVSLGVRPSLALMLHVSYRPDATTLRQVRQIDAIGQLPFFALEELNPKKIWDVGKIVRRWAPAKDPRPTGGASLVLLTTRAPAEMLPANLRKTLTITAMGEFFYEPENTSKFIYLSLIQFHK